MNMKISIDLDGMYFQHWEFLNKVVYGLKGQGDTVGILSCRSKEEHPQIGGYDFWYCAAEGRGNHQQECWVKADIIIKENIDVAFDDKGLLIYKYLVEKGHPEKVVFACWSVYTPGVAQLLG